MSKVTQLDAQIMDLERMGPNISPYEKAKLDILKERKTLLAAEGFEVKKTVKPNFKAPRSTVPKLRPARPSKTHLRSSNIPGQSKISSVEVAEEDSSHGLTTDVREKNIKGQEMSVCETEQRERRKVTDKKYYEKKTQMQLMKKNENEELKAKLEELVSVKKEKIDRKIKLVQNMKCDIKRIQMTKREVLDKVVEIDLELMVVKEQYKSIHKMHRYCGRDDS